MLHSTLVLSLQTQLVISWAQWHWRTEPMLVVFVTLPPSCRAKIFLLPSSLPFPIFLLCIVPAGCPWSFPACQAQHTALCSKAYGQQNKELAAGIWMWHKLTLKIKVCARKKQIVEMPGTKGHVVQPLTSGQETFVWTSCDHNPAISWCTAPLSQW